MPRRVQMTRQRPWRHEHPDAVIVARPSKWGNPFRPVRCDRRLHSDSLDEFAHPHWHILSDVEVTSARWATRGEAMPWAVKLFRLRSSELARVAPYWLEDVRADLAGRDLACWCPLDQPCHADVLLDLANQPTEGDPT